MSEENVPKLRLKPKLAAAPVNAPLPPAVVSPAAEQVPPPSVSGEAKAVRLKPKLAALSPQNVAPPAAAPETVPSPFESSSIPGGFPPPGGLSPASAPGAEKSAAKFALRPKVAVDPQATIPPAFPPPLPPTKESASQSPIPPPDYVDPERSDENPVMAVPRSVTSRPFPPPPANFPPPPTGGDKPAPPWAHSRTAAAEPKKKNFILVGGGVFVALAVLGGAFYAYKKFTAEPAPPPAKPTVTAVKKEPDPVVPPHEETKPVAAPVTETSPTVSVPETAPVEVAPPPPSPAFKAWVDALRIGGVRGGAAARVFIGGTAYAPGEVVNPQLGIVFDSYNTETRHVVFKDKTGATVERRN
jgi:hypothetical protein